MKKVMSSVLLVLVLVSSAFAIPAPTSAKEFGSINLNKVHNLGKTGNTKIEKISYDQYVKEVSKSRGISKKEVQKSSTNLSKKQFSTAATKYSMHKMTIVQDVGFLYQPKVQIYAWTYASGSFVQFKYIEDIDLDRYSSLGSKHFAGKVKAKITSPTAIWWYVNGDFYNNGTTNVSISGSGSAAVKGVTVTGSFSVSKSSNHYKYWNNSGTKHR
ncbi:hypothetical protein [Bacillus sp. FSL W8-0629]|uniref:hypothetical protein n=1 Tax=Bacillus sp. FSL W8-0629 TaxID=2954626 RepID=UPI0031587AC2